MQMINSFKSLFFPCVCFAPEELLDLVPEEPFRADAPVNFGTGGFRWAEVLFSVV